ncbi:MAG: hypothetical protein HYY84_06990 [Deltaproteobacteria bacterium]|nr:hypothetical protein [Deltaproteobacteria bacterium]
MREKFPGYQVEVDKQTLRTEEVYARALSCEACAKEREVSGDVDALCDRHLTELLAAEKMGTAE